MSKQITAAGIVVMANGLTTVRYTVDMVSRIKRLISEKAQRIDFVQLPTAMNKEEALAYISTLEKFSSEEDQRIIGDASDRRAAKPVSYLAALRELVGQVAKSAQGKSATWIHYEVTKIAKERGQRLACATTLNKYIQAALDEVKEEQIDPATMKQIVTTINLQTYNMVRAGVLQAQAAAVRLQATLAKKGIQVGEKRLVAMLAELKPGVFSA